MKKFSTVYGPLTESDIFPISGVSDEEKADVYVSSHKCVSFISPFLNLTC
jgi:hypothetical protein